MSGFAEVRLGRGFRGFGVENATKKPELTFRLEWFIC